MNSRTPALDCSFLQHRVRWLLHVSVATLTSLGTLLLSMEHISGWLPLFTAIAALTSLYLTDAKGWIQLNRGLGSVAAMLAVGIAIAEYLRGESMNHVLTIATLLAYLQIVLLYQEKSIRVIWQLIALSILQVVVAAAMKIDLWFGLLLVVYLFLTIWTLAIFFIYREAVPYESASQEIATHRTRTSPTPLFRWPWIRHRPVLHACTMDDPASAMLTWNLVRQVVWVGLFTLGITVVIFYGLPRSGGAAWIKLPSIQGVTGFQPTISLKQQNEILKSDEPIMRVTLIDELTGKASRVIDAPYFRGTALERYQVDSYGEGQWTSWGIAPREREGDPSTHHALRQDKNHTIRQEFVFQQQSSSTILAIAPFSRQEDTPAEIHHDVATGGLASSQVPISFASSGSYRYSLATTCPRDGTHYPLRPVERPLEASRVWHLLEFDRQAMPTLAQLAAQVVQENATSSDDSLTIARALESHFVLGTRYRYSLDRDIAFQEEIDPIEDFVANHPVGHCEYFASALCMMLRSQGIPARVVVGYQGGDYNSLGNFYQVKALHAHAWVEAYLPPEAAPQELLPPGAHAPYGAWVRLDGTPADPQSLAAEANSGLKKQISELLAYAQVLWDDHVLGLDSQWQQEQIYQPVAEKSSSAMKQLFSLQQWSEWFDGCIKAWDFDSWSSFAKRWFHWRAAVALLLLVMLIIGFLVAMRRTGPWFRRARGHRGNLLTRKSEPKVEFYRRLESLMQQHGMSRPVERTSREWILQLRREWVEEQSPLGEITGLEELVDHYYSLRYGQQPITPSQELEMEKTLATLQVALRQQKRTSAQHTSREV